MGGLPNTSGGSSQWNSKKFRRIKTLAQHDISFYQILVMRWQSNQKPQAKNCLNFGNEFGTDSFQVATTEIILLVVFK